MYQIGKKKVTSTSFIHSFQGKRYTSKQAVYTLLSIYEFRESSLSQLPREIILQIVRQAIYALGEETEERRSL